MIKNTITVAQYLTKYYDMNLIKQIKQNHFQITLMKFKNVKLVRSKLYNLVEINIKVSF